MDYTYITDSRPVTRTIMGPSTSVSSVPTSLAIVSRVADAEGVESRELAPLYESVDPDALDALVDSVTGGSTLSVQFTYCGYVVTVNADGVINVDVARHG